MNSSWKRVQQLGSILAIATLFAVAYGQAATCQTTYPLCSPTITTWQDTDCDNGGHWHIGSPEPFVMFACNNWYEGCGGTSGTGICNVMVEYSAQVGTYGVMAPGGTTFASREIRRPALT